MIVSKWKCEICGNKFDNFHAQGFDRKIYCPLCYFKKKYENAVADYEKTEFEKEQLNSLVNSCQEEIRRLKKQLEEYKEQVNKGLYNTCLPYSTGYNKAIKDKENQQKEFIEYMNKTIEELECDDVDDEEMKGYLIQRLDIFKEILKKYNEKVTDINIGNIEDERNEKIK